MRKKHLLIVAIAFLLLAISCQDGSVITQPENGEIPSFAYISLPEGAVFTSATIHMYILEPTIATVNIYRAVEPWDEMSLIYHDFDGDYDPVSIGSFTPNETGWHSTDLTNLVYEWATGIYPNYGIILEQGGNLLTIYASSDHPDVSIRPYVEICFEVDGYPDCVIVRNDTFGDVADTYLWGMLPYNNHGDKFFLYTGWGVGAGRISLIGFEVPQIDPQLGCTSPNVFWRNHCGINLQDDLVTQYLPIWLGNDNGDKSVHIKGRILAFAVLSIKEDGFIRNGIYKLYGQLLGAKLNIASGASDDDISEAITEADNILAMYDYFNWYSLDELTIQNIYELISTLSDYNNGLIGPGPCE